MPPSVADRLKAVARQVALPDGRSCQVVAVDALHLLSVELDISMREVAIAALRAQIIPERYLRNQQTLSNSDQIQLLEAHVCVVGLGGLGGMVSETLARLGIGRLTLIDGDRFEAHNLNRQLFSHSHNLGCAKADEAARRIATVYPEATITALAVHLDTTNARELIGDCHLVVDCLDTIPARFILATAACQAGLPMVSAAIAGMAGHVTTILPGSNSLETIYGPPDNLPAEKGSETRLGCLAPAVNLMASLECAEALKLLLGMPSGLSNQLLAVDLTDYTFETLQLS